MDILIIFIRTLLLLTGVELLVIVSMFFTGFLLAAIEYNPKSKPLKLCLNLFMKAS